MKKDGYVEADAPNPQSVYAKTKTAGEIAARENPNHYVIRLSRLFGKPAASVNAKKSFVDVMLALTEKHSSIDVVDGEFSSPTYAPDLARATYDMVKLQSPFGTYHRTNDGACTWFAFAQEIFRIAGKTVTVKPVPPEKFVRPAGSSSVLPTLVDEAPTPPSVASCTGRVPWGFLTARLSDCLRLA